MLHRSPSEIIQSCFDCTFIRGKDQSLFMQRERKAAFRQQKIFTSNHSYTRKSCALRALVRAALKIQAEQPVTCGYKILNPTDVYLRADLKKPFYTLHWSSQYQINIYRFTSQISQHKNTDFNPGIFYWPQIQRWETPNRFNNVCIIWWSNEKWKTEVWGTTVLCLLHFQLKYEVVFLKPADAKRWQLSYMGGYFSWWNFSLMKPWHTQGLGQGNLVCMTTQYWAQWGNYSRHIFQV